MKITFLGTGTSSGIPMIGCDCKVCASPNPKDKRLRTSAMVTINDINIVIDVGPDFRQQMLANQVKKVDAVLITHEHNDHIIGMDDIRPFNFNSGKEMNVFAIKRTADDLKERFKYIFREEAYPGAPKVKLNVIDPQSSFEIEGIKITPIEIMHGRMLIVGFRIGDFTYITDAKTIAPKEIEKIKGTKVLVLNALRRKEHHAHFTLQQAIDMVNEINPAEAYFTHFSHWLATHHELEAELPNNIFPAYDNLKLTL